ncbi:MAG: hypothetical protein ABI192_08885 [Bradyrhizobium sp.]
MTTGPLPGFIKLNEGWNAEPNAPHPAVKVSAADVLLEFSLNPFRFPEFDVDDRGTLRFSACSRYRLGGTNDEGWYRDQCRYSKNAPAWGEFYEISGADARLNEPKDWQMINEDSNSSRHFLFYLRDETFECIAADWRFEPQPTNALFRHFGTK